jgi:putative transposase
MARIARVVAPGLPHHITQRGNRGQQTFFDDDDYKAYRHLMATHAAGCGSRVWAYCLMPNHVHLIMVPEHEDGLRCAVAETHRRYTRRINARNDWRGHLWQERFHSFVMDEEHLVAAARYIERNPVRAGLCERAEDWPWSSARAHLAGRGDELVEVQPLLERVPQWRVLLAEPDEDPFSQQIHAHMRTGRPLGENTFVQTLEARLGRSLQRKKPGPKPKPKAPTLEDAAARETRSTD